MFLILKKIIRYIFRIIRRCKKFRQDKRLNKIELRKKIIDKPFILKSSKLHNPFKLKDYDLKTSLILYVLNLFKTGLIKQLSELKGKTIGCWCDKQTVNGKPHCHAQVLADLINKCSHLL